MRVPCRQLFRGGYSVYTIGVDPSIPLGVLALAISRESTHIDYICVDKGSRSLGLGSRLLEWTKSRYPVLTLECRPELAPYYQARGFSKVCTYQWRGVRLVFMSTLVGRHLDETNETSETSETSQPTDKPIITDCGQDFRPKIPVCVRFIELFFKLRIS